MRPLSHLRRLLQKLAASRSEQRRFAATAWLAAPLVELSLAAWGLERTLRWIEAVPRASRARPRSLGPDEARRLVDGIYRYHLLRGACLSRSLLQYALHRRDGTAARLVVGVRRAVSNSSGQGSLEAHAWVEGPSAQRERAGYAALLSRESGAAEP